MKPSTLIASWVAILLVFSLAGYAIYRSSKAEKTANRAVEKVYNYSADTEKRFDAVDSVGYRVEWKLDYIIRRVDTTEVSIYRTEGAIERNQRSIERLWQEKKDK